MNKQVSTMGLLGIMSMYLISMGVTVVTPAMAIFAAQFPNENFALISTFPTLFTTIFSLLVGAVVGKNLKYRTCAIAGSVIFLVGGVLPAFVESFTLVLVGRAILGIGLGIMAPLGNALILGLYDGQKQAKYLGYGTLLMNAGGIVYQQLGGNLAGLGWHAVFYGHLFGIVGLIGALFIPEPEGQAPAADTKEAGPKAPLGTVAIIVAILFFLFNVLNYPVMMNLSLVFEQKGAGTAATAATALSMYTVAGCVSGLIYGKTAQVLGRFSVAFGFLASALGAFLVYIGPNALVMTLGLMCIGFAFSVLMPAGLGIIGMNTHPTRVAFATSLAIAFMNLGGFACAYWLQIIGAVTGDTLYMPIILEVVVLAALGIAFIVINPYGKKN